MALLLAPISAPAPVWRSLIEAALPGLEVRVWPELGDPAGIEVAAGAHFPHGALAKLPRLKLIAALTAGAELLLADRQLPKAVPLVRTGNPAGDEMMCEVALLHVLRHHRFLPEYQLSQARREWRQMPRQRARERKVGVMGLGFIGLTVAERMRDHGFDVAGWARRAREVRGIKVFHGPAQLKDFLARSEIVVNLLPLTPETVDILDRATFALMPKGAQLINLARGQHVVDADLIAALDSGQLSAATLDVYRQEPLPAADPLWAHPRITLMPHVSRRIDPAEIVPQLAEEVRRLQQGLPPLRPIDRETGY